MAEAPRIEPGSRVRMHLHLSLRDGTVALSTFGEEPLAFTLGDGTLLPTLETALLGLAAGSEHTWTLGPGDAYGPREESLVQVMPATDFGDNLAPEPGQIIAFSLPSGEETTGTVVSMDDDRITVDFNHPLAGRDLIMHVEILSVQQPKTAKP
ncbi:MAG: peptidylprolyl isomerase [Pseudomonadota bacterium]